MSVKIVLDPGSCHNGDIVVATRLIDRAADVGADAVKFQLFLTPTPGNIPLPYEFFPELVHTGQLKGIEVFASVWDMEGYRLMKTTGCKSIKFAYSQRTSHLIHKAILNDFENIYVSDDSVQIDYPGKVKKLYCVPQYPLTHYINFDGLFDELFYGFSDHSITSKNAEDALQNGAHLIERHFQIKSIKSPCNDAKFALDGKGLKTFMAIIKSWERIYGINGKR